MSSSGGSGDLAPSTGIMWQQPGCAGPAAKCSGGATWAGQHFPAWVFKFCSIFSALNECFDLQRFQAPAAPIDSGGLYGSQQSSGLSCSMYMPKFGYSGWEPRVLYSAGVCVSPAVGYGAKLGLVGKVFSKQGQL